MFVRVFILTLAVACAGLNSGCATHVARLTDYQPQPISGRVKIIDDRAAKEKNTSLGSLLITDCDYAIRTLGDEISDPTRLVLLREQLENYSQLAKTEFFVTVSKYSIHQNLRAQIRGSVNRAFADRGAIVGALTSIGNDCSSEETGDGWYTLDEISPPNNGPFVIQIAAKINDIPVSERVLFRTSRMFAVFRMDEPDAAAELFSAMKEANNRLIQSYQRHIK